MRRRTWLAGMTALGLGAWWGHDAMRRFWPRAGLWRDCEAGPTPAALLADERVRACWEGIDPAQCWDAHVHLIGVGNNGSGVWINPHMRDWRHPLQFAQFQFYLNASCAADAMDSDGRYLRHLQGLLAEFPAGYRALLLAFDYHYDPAGTRRLEHSPFHTPNAYALTSVGHDPERLEWIASVHPYREDALGALRQAHEQGARAIKWLPAAMGMDPAAPRCDAFYETLHALDMPLLVHCGTEYAVHGGGAQELGNPLRLRRALERGVRVLVAHCASLGTGTDLDRGPHGPQRSNFDLFARLLDSPDYRGRVFGEISAVTQVNRVDAILDTLLSRVDWHEHLINGSDYPLPGIPPIISPGYLRERGLLTADQDDILRAIQPHNPLLFDFLLKRMLRKDGQGFAPAVFMTRRHFVDKH